MEKDEGVMLIKDFSFCACKFIEHSDVHKVSFVLLPVHVNKKHQVIAESPTPICTYIIRKGRVSVYEEAKESFIKAFKKGTFSMHHQRPIVFWGMEHRDHFKKILSYLNYDLRYSYQTWKNLTGNEFNAILDEIPDVLKTISINSDPDDDNKVLHLMASTMLNVYDKVLSMLDIDEIVDIHNYKKNIEDNFDNNLYNYLSLILPQYED